MAMVLVACHADAVPVGGTSGTTATGTTTSVGASTGSGGATSSGSSADATGSSTLLDSGGSDSTTGGGPAMPPPSGRRWVLRDADGVAIDAVVEPTCRSAVSNCVFPPIGHTGPISPQCVRVIQLGEQYVDINYAAATGRPEDCLRLGTSPTFEGAFPTADCALPGYTGAGAGTGDAFEWRREPFGLDDGTVLYESRVPPVDLAMGYWWNAGQCEAIPFFNGNDLVPWPALPAWAADALPNPPYVLSWE